MSIAEKLHTVAENQQKVYDAGKQAEYDALWDSLQNYGNRTSYAYAFAGSVWTNTAFKPKYPLIAVGTAAYMFDGCVFPNIDFVENGIEFDISNATGLTYIFRNCKGLKRLGVMDCRGCTDLNRLFYGCSVETIDKFIVSENTTCSATFEYASSLKSIIIEGVFGKNISFFYCPLTKDSLLSVMAALSDNVTGKTLTLKQTAVNGAFTTDEWNALVATKPNWTITLA